MKPGQTKVTNYYVRVNGDFHQAFTSLGEARMYLRTMRRSTLDEDITVELVKQVIIDTVMNEYKTEAVKVLVAGDLSL